jgi:hypothetical protein
MDSDAEELGHVHAAVRKMVSAIGGKREADQQRGFRVTEMDTLPERLSVIIHPCVGNGFPSRKVDNGLACQSASALA